MLPADQVSVLGTGALGTAVARALLAAGRPVVVWNRTPDRAAGARAAGAAVAATAAEAVAASPLTLVCLTDQDAARDVLASVDAPPPRRTVVLLTTGTPDEAVEMHALLTARGVGHLDAGVQSSPEDVGTDRARFLVSGDPDDVARHRATLELLGRVDWVGADPAAAAVWDLALFGLWYDAHLGLLRALELTTAAGVDPRAFAEAAEVTLGHVVAGARGTAEEVQTGQHPRGPASLAEHLPLLRRLVASRAAARTGDGGLPAVIEAVDRLVAAGAGERGLTAVVAEDPVSAG